MTWNPEILLPAEASREELVEWLGRQFRSISDWTASQPVQGYGGLVITTNQAQANIPAGTWATIPFQSGMLPTPINFEQDPTNNRIRVTQKGVQWFSFYGVLTVQKDAVNDRALFMRAVNDATGVPAHTNPFPGIVENNANWCIFSINAPMLITDPTIYYRFEVGGSTFAFNNLLWYKVGASLIRIDNLP